MKEMNNQLKIDQALVDKVKDYCSLSTMEVLKEDKGSRKALFYAEEATQEILLRFHKYNQQEKFTEDKRNDNFIFISCKNQVRNTIKSETRYKRTFFKDQNSINLDTPSQDNDFIYEIEDNSLEDYHKEENNIKEKLQFIVDLLNKSPFVRDFDIKVFFAVFVDGFSCRDYADKNNLRYPTVLLSKKRIKNIINHYYDKE